MLRLGVIFISMILAAVEGKDSDFPALIDEALGVRETERPSQTWNGFAGDNSGKNSSKLILKGVQRGLCTPFHRTAQKLFKWNSLQLLE